MVIQEQRLRQGALRTGCVVSVALIFAVWRHWLPMNGIELMAALTGAWGVWLTVGESLWTWPVGIASSLLFAILFFHQRFYGSAAMQLVYVALSAVGWYWWLHGGNHRQKLGISRVISGTAAVLAAVSVAALPGLYLFLRHLHDASPLPDAAALILCLAAQYLVTRKNVEHWCVSLAADLIYIALYWSHGLFLTGSLYLMHGGTCVVGLWQWRRSLDMTHDPTAPTEALLV